MAVTIFMRRRVRRETVTSRAAVLVFLKASRCHMEATTAAGLEAPDEPLIHQWLVWLVEPEASPTGIWLQVDT